MNENNINNLNVTKNNEVISDKLPFPQSIIANTLSSAWFVDVLTIVKNMTNSLWKLSVELGYDLWLGYFNPEDETIIKLANSTAEKLNKLGDKYINKTIDKIIDKIDYLIDPNIKFFNSSLQVTSINPISYNYQSNDQLEENIG